MLKTGQEEVAIPTVIRLTDYGAKPNSGKDAQRAMRLAIEAAASHSGAIILDCPHGRYDFYPEEAVRTPYYVTNTASEEENSDVTKTVALWFKGMSELILEGNGSLFVFHGKQTMLVMDDCFNMEVRNLNMDYERPTVVEMSVERSHGCCFDVRVHPDSRYELEDGKLFWIGEGWRFREGPMQEYDPERNTTWRIDNLIAQAVHVEELEPMRLRLFFDYSIDMAAGRVLQARDGLRDQVGAFILRSRNIRWQRVGMHFMHGLGIVCQYSEDLCFEEMNLSPRAETGRTVAAFADFIHVSGCRGVIRITNSQFVGGHDDPINVHGTHLRIMDIPAPNRLLVRFMHPQSYGFQAFFPGDAIALVRAATLGIYGTGSILSVDWFSPREIVLTLAEPVPEETRIGDVIENVTWTPEVVISGNYFARIPTRGILVTTRRKAVIEHNVFDRLAMSGVLVANDAESWYESGAVQDLTIRGNQFRECGWGNGQPAILIAPENSECDANKPVHQNIRIENNRFWTGKEAVLHAKSTRSLLFSNNEINVLACEGEQDGGQELIALTACSDETISANEWIGDGAMRMVINGKASFLITKKH
ncbi:right-handed parallel beta-helix repeat-containing protein [Paenibacillus paridis]|uniref:right-handed parallel beta-helix repeat-containing protein n=1 Tax=Paenibacillus paridis TaxID=2583376 RepID=UPI00112448FC|nr:right-handed parallel beta-helix repeat-containing protein [Paenibacillus paridis]